MPNVFISYHHANDQWYKNELVRMGATHNIFNDKSVTLGEISDTLDDQAIRQKIRDEYLRDTTVTVVLVGTETWGRKHVDWEIYSSMFDGQINKKSGILVINLPSTGITTFTTSHANEKEVVHPETQSWITITERSKYDERYPQMPDRIIDNLVSGKAKISVVPWEKIGNSPVKLKFLIDATWADRASAVYDLSRSMRRKDAAAT
jgi:hypothetical protein